MRHSLIASTCIFLCRFTGMARALVLTSLFGATGALDAFYTAFRIPNLLRDLFAEGALSQSYTSVTAKVRETQGDRPAWELTNKIATQLTTLMVAIVTIGIVLSGPLMEALYTKSPSASALSMATDMCRIMWPFILFASLSALTMGALNIVGVFGLPMMASAAFNVVTIGLGFLLGWWIDPSFGPDALYGFSIAVVFGGLAQWLVQVPRLRREGFRWKPNFKWRDSHVFKIWGLMIPSVMASGTTQFNVLINNAFALELREGSVAALTTAFQLWQLPVGLFGVATGMVVLPAVSRMMVGEGRGEVAGHIAKALRLVAFFAVPSLVVLGILGEQCVSVVFQWGKFDASAVSYTGSVLTAYSIGLLGYAGTKVVQPVFLALEKRWVPLIAAVVALSISVSLNYTFVRILHKDASWLALTTSVITTLNFLFYFLYLRKQLGGICGGMLFSGLVRIALAGIVFAAVCLAGREWLLSGFTSWGFMPRIGMLALIGGAGGLAYLAVAWVLRTPELMLFKERVLQRVHK